MKSDDDMFDGDEGRVLYMQVLYGVFLVSILFLIEPLNKKWWPLRLSPHFLLTYLDMFWRKWYLHVCFLCFSMACSFVKYLPVFWKVAGCTNLV